MRYFSFCHIFQIYQEDIFALIYVNLIIFEVIICRLVILIHLLSLDVFIFALLDVIILFLMDLINVDVEFVTLEGTFIILVMYCREGCNSSHLLCDDLNYYLFPIQIFFPYKHDYL